MTFASFEEAASRADALNKAVKEPETWFQPRNATGLFYVARIRNGIIRERIYK